MKSLKKKYLLIILLVISSFLFISIILGVVSISQKVLMHQIGIFNTDKLILGFPIIYSRMVSVQIMAIITIILGMPTLLLVIILVLKVSKNKVISIELIIILSFSASIALTLGGIAMAFSNDLNNFSWIVNHHWPVVPT